MLSPRLFFSCGNPFAVCCEGGSETSKDGLYVEAIMARFCTGVHSLFGGAVYREHAASGMVRENDDHSDAAAHAADVGHDAQCGRCRKGVAGRNARRSRRFGRDR
jgi:hypothetical protein